MKARLAAGRYFLAAVVTFWIGGPLLWIAFTSLRIPLRVSQYPPTLEGPFTSKNYSHVLGSLQLADYLRNSLVVDGAATLLALALGLAAAYRISLSAPKNARRFQWAVLVARMVPPVALIVPIYFIYNSVGLLNSRVGLGLVYVATSLPLAIWMLSAYLRQVPAEVLQAAWVDGAGPLQLLWSVLAPMMLPGLVAVGVLTFLANWNEFMMAVTLTSSTQSATAPVALVQLDQEYGVAWQYLSAAVVLSIVVPVIIGAISQRHIVSGITTGATKQ